jgi:hypothetical protein
LNIVQCSGAGSDAGPVSIGAGRRGYGPTYNFP